MIYINAGPLSLAEYQEDVRAHWLLNYLKNGTTNDARATDEVMNPRDDTDSCGFVFAPLMSHVWEDDRTFPPTSRQYARNVRFLEAGYPVENISLIESGLIKLLCVNPAGREMIIGLRSSGWLIGGAAGLARAVSPYSAVTVTETRLRTLGRDQFCAILERDGELRRRFALMLSYEFSAQIRQSIEIRSETAEGRLKRFLSELQSIQEIRVEGTSKFRLPLKQTEIAQLLAITPEHLCRLLKKDRSSRRSRGS